MMEDRVLATPECRAFTERRFRGRPLTVIPSATALAAVLGSSQASSLMFCGRWSQLTVEVSRSLADWASQDPARGCGLFLATETRALAAANRAEDNSCVYDLVDGQQAREYRANGTCGVAADELVARLLNPGLPAPTGLALTGHGAEYCIRLGSYWLSTFETELLAGPIVLPSFSLGSVVFLNSCSSLRLGDSSIPEKLSLARVLCRFNSAVIGSFRNLHTSLLHGQVFAEALLEGEPLGRVVNRLNEQARSAGGGDLAFQLLGDPVMRLMKPRAAPTMQSRPAQSIDPEPNLLRLIAEAAQLEQVSASFARWMRGSLELGGAHTGLMRSVDRAGQAVHASRMAALSAEELVMITQELDSALDTLRGEVLLTLARFIQANGWIQTAYAPLCRRTRSTPAVCERCGAPSLWTRYEPFASYLSSVDCEQCDRCGTTRERIGDGLYLEILDVQPQPEAECLTVRMSPLPKRSRGLLLFHRMPGFTPFPWPEQGGREPIPYAQLSFRGRLTLVAAVLGPRCAALQYHTFFVGPVQGRRNPARARRC